MKTTFPLISALAEFLEPFNAPWYLAGGWAIDLHLGRQTRPRGDLDIIVPRAYRHEIISFILAQGWRIEGRLGGGFKAIHSLTDYTDEIRYFWSFPADVGFISDYMDEQGIRRLSYDREEQTALDYLEVFFDRIEEGLFIYRREPGITLPIEQAILEKDGIQYLSLEMGLLYKSQYPDGKNKQDFHAALTALDAASRSWLADNLQHLYGSEHVWLPELK